MPPNQPPLDWFKRMKIALHAAKGLEYLHDSANPPVIYRDLKSSNILLDDDFNAKLSDFGLAKLGPVGDKTHVSSRVMGTYGYCAPEYQLTGQLTVKSDVYSFGVVLLELITGRRAIDTTKDSNEQNLAVWVSCCRYLIILYPILKFLGSFFLTMCFFDLLLTCKKNKKTPIRQNQCSRNQVDTENWQIHFLMEITQERV